MASHLKHLLPVCNRGVLTTISVAPCLSIERHVQSKKSPNRQTAHVELWPQRFVLPERDHGYIPTLSPSQISSILYINEGSFTVPESGQIGAVKSFESNQLASNQPIEDRRAIAQLNNTDGSLYAVFDGHAGAACAQSVSQRLFDYIGLSLLTQSQMEDFARQMRTEDPMELLSTYQFFSNYVNEEDEMLYRNSLHKYAVESLSTGGIDDGELSVEESLRCAFQRLDNDISAEALASSGQGDMDAIEVALSGSCACVAHIQDRTLHIANTGDTRAVLGKRDAEGNWIATSLSTDQNCDNEIESERVRSSHPANESTFILKNGRLLGQLIPLRAFGDVRYKWDQADLKKLMSKMNTPYIQSVIPMNYYSPPYLIVEPEVMRYELEEDDQFLVLATDGLWEMLSNEEVVRLVGEHLTAKQTTDIFEMPPGPVQLGALNKMLVDRKYGLAHKSGDVNVATHLIRNALGGEHCKVSELLTLPQDVVRYYRDDITIIVVFFDQDYVRKKKNE